MKSYIFKKGLISAALLFAASSSYASLIFVANENFGGTGLGAVNTILTIQEGNSRDVPAGFEQGSVSFNGSEDVVTGDAKKGNSQTQTRSITELGLTSASSLRVVFNALEPGNDGTSISLDNLILTIYSSNGIELFNSGAFAPKLFADTFAGAGNSGFVFALDAQQAAAAQLAAFSQGSFGTNRIGLSATATLAAGGFETFFVANAGGGGGNGEVPEPATVALVGLGLLGFAASRRKSKTT